MHLLKHFKILSLHTKNVKELKTLILQLAVQGKLTEKWRTENPHVESASNLLKKIYKEKERLISNKIFKAKYDTDYFEPLIERPIIPENWLYVTVGNICELLTGATPSRAKASYFGGDIKWLVSGDIHLGYIYDCAGRITEEGMSSSNCKILPVNSVMMALNGQGKTRATVALLKTGATCNQSLLAMKPFLDDENLSEYIYYLLKGKYFQIRDITGQHQRRGLNMTLVSQLPIALPPLEEQKAIVEVVNQLFKEVEQLEQLTVERIKLKEKFVVSALNQLTTNNAKNEWAFLQEHFHSFFNEKNNIKNLRETVLLLAVQGKLTADWRANNPNIEDASILLKRIQQEKAQLIKGKKIKKEIPLPAIIKEDIPYELPKGWVWCRLGNITDIIAGASFKSGDFNEINGIKCIKITNAGVREFVETNDFLPSNFEQLYPNYLIKGGDLILALTRPYIKDGLKISVCPTSYHNSLLNQRVASIRSMSEEIYHPYIFSFIQSPKVLKYYKSKFDGKSQQPNMKMEDITELAISLPSLEEQKAIVVKVNALMGLCDALEQQVKQSQEQSEQLMQSVLREVFEGKKSN